MAGKPLLSYQGVLYFSTRYQLFSPGLAESAFSAANANATPSTDGAAFLLSLKHTFDAVSLENCAGKTDFTVGDCLLCLDAFQQQLRHPFSHTVQIDRAKRRLDVE